MKSKRLKGLGALLLLVLTLSTLVLVPLAAAREEQSPMRQEIGTNLLANPGFEGIGKPVDNSQPNYGNWTRDTFTGVQYGEIFTPEGWVTWWQEGDFGRPECKVIPNEAPFNTSPVRIYQGYYAGMCFTFFRKQNAGYYQVVRNVAPGTVVEASYAAHAWSCSEDTVTSCGDPYAFYFRVGIDPNGGTDPFSSNIVWSQAYYHYDKYGIVGPVQATVGESGAVTFFTQFYGKWPNKHNDAYSDNMSLKVVSQGTPSTPTPEPPPPTSAAPPTAIVPQNTPTPRPDGAIVHIVVAGDTMFGLAIEYGVDLDELRRLNAGTVINDFLSIGQEVIISGAPVAVPTATPQPQTTPETQTTPEATQPPASGGLPAAPTGNKAALCVLAYYDANNDMFRQADSGEMALPNAEITLVGMAGPAGTYKTDGISEPYCFQDLEPGNYILRHTAPPGYKLTDAGQWNIPLNAGQVSSLNLGYTRDESAGSSPATTQENPNATATTPAADKGEEKTGGVTKVLNTVLRITGIIVLILAIAVGVLFFLSRRSM
ncbi:MAG TPA: LysM peptidoglycan-binding domain-containing protein [Anaerolineae bacterium]|nr:LysM peptidoglycan-binding domain-containing protein [Anaerolineae bacterium]HQI87053.1 LysM peptidoglycan-binding domain-containing protein [Anaerolineae bacterium]